MTPGLREACAREVKDPSHRRPAAWDMPPSPAAPTRLHLHRAQRFVAIVLCAGCDCCPCLLSMPQTECFSPPSPLTASSTAGSSAPPGPPCRLPCWQPLLLCPVTAAQLHPGPGAALAPPSPERHVQVKESHGGLSTR